MTPTLYRITSELLLILGLFFTPQNLKEVNFDYMTRDADIVSFRAVRSKNGFAVYKYNPATKAYEDHAAVKQEENAKYICRVTMPGKNPETVDLREVVRQMDYCDSKTKQKLCINEGKIFLVLAPRAFYINNTDDRSVFIFHENFSESFPPAETKNETAVLKIKPGITVHFKLEEKKLREGCGEIYPEKRRRDLC